MSSNLTFNTMVASGASSEEEEEAHKVSEVSFCQRLKLKVHKWWLQPQKTKKQKHTYKHIWDHVIWDFFIPEAFCDEAVTVALGHAAGSAWNVQESISLRQKKKKLGKETSSSCESQFHATAAKTRLHTTASEALYLVAGCSWFSTPR